MGCVPEIECPDCDGWGDTIDWPLRLVECPACHGEGWRPMNGQELADADADAAERQAEEARFRSDLSLDEQHLRAWEQHRQTHRG